MRLGYRDLKRLGHLMETSDEFEVPLIFSKDGYNSFYVMNEKTFTELTRQTPRNTITNDNKDDLK